MDRSPLLERFQHPVWPYLLLLAVGLVLLLPQLDEIGFWDPWEPKYVQSAREMSERGSLVVPYYRGDVRLTKPILSYWGILAGTSVFGMNEFGSRIVGVTLAIAAMLGLYYAVSSLRGRRAGLLAALVLGTIPQFSLLARQAMPDVYLYTSLGTALVFFYLALRGPKSRSLVHFVISYVGFALAVLAKGPVVAGAVCGVALVLYALLHVDFSLFWQPDTRWASLRVGVLGAVAATALPLAGLTAFLLGTSRRWWGPSESDQAQVAAGRQQLIERAGQLHAGQILLAAVAVLAAFVAVRLYADRRLPSSGRLGGCAGAVIVSLLALVLAVVAPPIPRLLLAAVLGGIAILGAVLWAVADLLRRPSLWPLAEPLLRPAAYQLALFAAVFVAVAGPWHAAIFMRQGQGYFTDFILKHNVARVAGVVNRTGDALYYVDTVIFGYFPWCVLFPLALGLVLRRASRRDDFAVYLLLVSATVFVLFSSAETKFSHYLSPMLLPAAGLLGLTLDRLTHRAAGFGGALAWGLAGLCYLHPMSTYLKDTGLKYLLGAFTVKRALPDAAQPGWYFKTLLFAVLALLAAGVVPRLRRWIAVGLPVVAGLLIVYQNAVFIPRVSEIKSVKQLCEHWQEHRTNEDPLGHHGDYKHGMFFYTDSNWERLRTERETVEFLNPARSRFCVVGRKRLPGVRRYYERRFPGYSLETVDVGHKAFVIVNNGTVDAR